MEEGFLPPTVTIMAEHTAQDTGHWTDEINSNVSVPYPPSLMGEHAAMHGHMELALGRVNKRGLAGKVHNNKRVK